MREAGATLVFGSDWPVVSHDPFRGISNAVNRSPWAKGMPEQRQTLEDALIAYTRDAAYAEFQDHQKGQIREGYLADLVMLTKDIFEIPSQEIGALKPTLTMMDGRIVHEAR